MFKNLFEGGKKNKIDFLMEKNFKFNEKNF